MTHSDSDAEGEPATPASPEQESVPVAGAAQPTLSRWGRVFYVAFGIVLPLAALGLKQTCAEVLFDPAPTLWHIALILLIPAFHLTVLLVQPERQRRLHLDLLGAATLGIA